MLKATLKFYALQKLSFYVGIAMLALIAYGISTALHSRGVSQRELAAYNRDTAKEESDELTALIVKYKMNEDAWNGGIKDVYATRDGINLDVAKKIIENLRVANNIKNLSINLTDPMARDDIGSLKFTKLIHSRMNISLLAASDKDVIRFLSKLAEDLPGTIGFTNMQMTVQREKDSTQVINAKVELQWQNLEDAS